jgi:hypothetical protein
MWDPKSHNRCGRVSEKVENGIRNGSGVVSVYRKRDHAPSETPEMVLKIGGYLSK